MTAVNTSGLHSAITQSVATLVESGLSISVHYPNHPWSEPAEGSIWCMCQVSPGTQSIDGFGAPGANPYQHVGVLTLSVYGPLGKGEAAILAKVEAIKAAFRSTTRDGVSFLSPYHTVLGELPGKPLWAVAVTIPYRAEEYA